MIIYCSFFTLLCITGLGSRPRTVRISRCWSTCQSTMTAPVITWSVSRSYGSGTSRPWDSGRESVLLRILYFIMPLWTQILIMVWARGKNRIYINPWMCKYMYSLIIFITVEKVLIDDFKERRKLISRVPWSQNRSLLYTAIVNCYR